MTTTTTAAQEINRHRRAVLDAELHAHGFPVTDYWRREAQRTGFPHGYAETVIACPSCGRAPGKAALGGFAYYANYFRLRDCPSCDLLWVDRRLPPAVVAAHFERVYKDETYYRVERGPALAHMADLAAMVTLSGDSVLDVGGGTGYLLAMIQERRGDLHLYLQDVSGSALRVAEERLPCLLGGLNTMVMPIPAFPVLYPKKQFACVVASDVLYYEPDLMPTFRALGRLVAPGGQLLIRVPNKQWAIRAAAWLQRLPLLGLLPQRRIRWFNPEHLYVLTPEWLRSTLTRYGFSDVRFLPSPLPGGSRLNALWYRAAVLVHRLTGWVLTPGMVVSALKRP